MPTNDSSNREREIFEQALEIASAEERCGFLRAACGGDAALLERVQALLHAHEHADGFLPDQPAAGPGALDVPPSSVPAEGPAEAGTPNSAAFPDAPTAIAPAADEGVRAPWTEGPGTIIGRYKLLEKIGEGGFGAVYVAEQLEPVKRRVALKIIKLGMDTKSVIARFEAERQALALMDHPNIAKVFDAGATGTGRPFFVMELVRGVPITEYCDKSHLSARERLELFLPVCQAIQHAHQKGIIHRDLKPSNVLVAFLEGRPVPMVIDFGIAKATHEKLTEKTLFTNLGQMIGTPAYMSPEQAEMSRLDVDTRSDIYSMGVLLYELLTGTTPFPEKRLRSAAFGEIQRIIAEEEPERPSTRLSTMANEQQTTVARNRSMEVSALGRLLRGDLDWIAMKCLEKDRTRRYETANSLEVDLRRHLNNETISARQPSAAYRFQKLVRRNKLAFAAAATVVAALVLGLGTSTWMFFRERRAHQRALDSEREQSRLRREETVLRQRVEKGQIELRNTVSDLQTRSGLTAHEQQQSAIAALWFANAARSSENDPIRQKHNRLRAENWLRLVPKPVRAIRVPIELNTDSEISFHPTGDYLIVRAAGPSFFLWDIVGDKLLEFPEITADLIEASFLDHGQKLLLASASGSIRIYTFPALKFLYSISAEGAITYVALDSREQQLAVATWTASSRLSKSEVGGGIIKIWDLAQQKWFPLRIAQSNLIEIVRFSEGGDKLITVDADALARIFQITSEKNSAQLLFPPVRHIEGSRFNKHRFPPLVFDNDRGLLTLSTREELTWRNAQTGEQLESIQLEGNSAIMGWSVIPQQPLLVVIGFRRGAIWDIRKRKLVAQFDGHQNSIVDVAFPPDGRFIMTASLDRTTRFWHLSKGSVYSPINLTDEVYNVAFNPEGWGFATFQADGLVQLWRFPDQGPFLAQSIPPLGARSLVTVSPDGKLAALSGSHFPSETFETQAYSLADLRPIGSPVRVGTMLLAAAFSPDGKKLATLSLRSLASTKAEDALFESARSPGKLEIWNVQNGQRFFEPFVTSSLPLECQFSPDGKQVVALSAVGEILSIDPTLGKVRFRALHPDGQRLARLRENFVRPRWIGFTPDGGSFITCGYSTCVWNAETGRLRSQPFPHDLPCFDFDISRDGKFLATGSQDKHLRIWDLSSGNLAGNAIQHPDWLFRVRFSHNGEHILTACRDGTARIWNWRTGTQLGPALKHSDEVYGAAFLPSEELVVTATRNAYVQVWDWRTATLIAPPLYAGLIPHQMRLVGDTYKVVIGQGSQSFEPRVFDLEELVRGERIGSNDELVATCEIGSGAELHALGEISPLTTQQWLAKWRKLDGGKPAELPTRRLQAK